MMKNSSILSSQIKSSYMPKRQKDQSLPNLRKIFEPTAIDLRSTEITPSLTPKKDNQSSTTLRPKEIDVKKQLNDLKRTIIKTSK